LDWGNKPLPFKIYSTLEVLRLPREMRHTEIAALAAIAESVPAQTEAVPDLETLARLLFLSAGITRHRKYPGGESYFRAAACTARFTNWSCTWFAGEARDAIRTLNGSVHGGRALIVNEARPKLCRSGEPESLPQ